jgi:membrane peptidoglycan carboxypeptidase
VAGDGTRQPGSAWKPVLYAAAFDAKKLTPGSLLLDVTTEFDRAQHWAPTDADQRERGPVLVKKAVQYSLNIPAIRALERVGNKRVADTAVKMGIRFAGGKKAFLQSGLAGALGTVEVRPLDLTSAYGTIANGGVRVPPRMVLEVRAPDGHTVWKAPQPAGEQAISSGAAYLVTDILAGNTDPKQNDIWAAKLELRGANGKRRPAAAKTGTTNDARDLGTYGYLPPTKDGVGLVVGVWMGNSDHSYPRAKQPAISLTSAAPLWRAFMRDYTKSWPITSFRRPKDVVQARIDAWSGGKPGPWTHETTTAWFIRGTQPGAKGAIDDPGLLYRAACGSWRVDPVKAELGPSAWRSDVANWLSRAHRGVGVVGRYGSATAYFWHESSWGGSLAGSCYRPRPPSHDGGHDRGNDKKHKKEPGGGGGPPPPPPEPTPAPTP